MPRCKSWRQKFGPDGGSLSERLAEAEAKELGLGLRGCREIETAVLKIEVSSFPSATVFWLGGFGEPHKR